MVRDSKTVILMVGLRWRSSLATEQPVIPEPIMTISVASGRVSDCVFSNTWGGCCQYAAVGLGLGRPGSELIRSSVLARASVLTSIQKVDWRGMFTFSCHIEDSPMKYLLAF